MREFASSAAKWISAAVALYDLADSVRGLYKRTRMRNDGVYVSMNRLLESLTDPQREAVTHRDGPLLVLAGPGSGKTRVITHRIAYLLRERRCGRTRSWPSRSPTRRPTRCSAAWPSWPPATRVWISTFHRFGAMLLRRYAEHVGLQPNFTIYDTNDSRQTIKRVIEARNINTLNYTPDRLAEAISAAKNKLITADKYEPRSGSMLSRIVAEVYPAYQERLLASSAVDFDDLLLHVAQLLFEHPEIREELDERFRYVLVDEYQDTNLAQYVMLRALSTDYPNLAVTGDPDQSIYGWRGADLNNILEFEHDYPNVRIVRLERNYRSTKRILRIADSLIRTTCAASTKRCARRTRRRAGAAGRVRDQDHEAKDIAEQIRSAVAAGKRKPSDFAIFYRVNALSRSIEKALRAAGVPYQMIRGLEFYARKEIKDVLAYCQLVEQSARRHGVRADGQYAAARHRQEDDRPARRVRRIATACRCWKRRGRPAQIEGLSKGAARRRCSAFVEIIDRIAAVVHGDVEEIIGTVLEASGYRASLAESDDEQDQNRLANIEELLTDARQFDEENPGGGHLEAVSGTHLARERDRRLGLADRQGHADDAARGQGAGVSGRVHRGGRGRRAAARARRPASGRTGRRAAAGVRRHHAGQGGAATVVRRDPRLPRPAAADDSQLVPDGNAARGDGAGRFGWHVRRVGVRSVGRRTATTTATIRGTIGRLKTWRSNRPAAATRSRRSAWRPRRSRRRRRSSDEPCAASRRPKNLPRVSPDEFKQGMTVTHPEYGPGKIVSLAGSGKNRRATIQFATVGQKKIILIHSAVRPAG